MTAIAVFDATLHEKLIVRKTLCFSSRNSKFSTRNLKFSTRNSKLSTRTSILANFEFRGSRIEDGVESFEFRGTVNLHLPGTVTPNLEDQGTALSGPSPADQSGWHSSGGCKGTQASLPHQGTAPGDGGFEIKTISAACFWSKKCNDNVTKKLLIAG